MRYALLATACLLCVPWRASAWAPADDASRSAALSVLRGPTAAFAGRQRSVVYLDNGSTAETQVAVYGDGKGRTRREYESGMARGAVVLHIGGSTWQRTPNGSWSRLPTVPHLDAAKAASLAAESYRVSTFRVRSLLGRPTMGVRLEPRRPFCPSRTVWLDSGSGVLLRDELRAPDGKLRSSSEYVSLAVGSQPAPLFVPPAGAATAGLFGPASFSARPTAAAVERDTGRRIGLPSHVPAGFRVTAYGVMTTGSGRLMPALRYSDGLAAFTVFQRGWGAGQGRGMGMGPGMGMGRGRMGRGPAGPRGVGRGGQCTMMRSGLQESVVEWRGQQSNYLLVGDISADELRKVAGSLP